MRKLGYILLIAILFANCEKRGDLNDQQVPDTFISVAEINLEGENRLNSQVRLSWFGTDKDGFIEGFEININNTGWIYTTTQDSIFRFPIPPGSDTADIAFEVRAIDNDNNTDPTPATLGVPVKNSQPVATINADYITGDSVLGVLTFLWSGTDPDGDETIQEAQLKLNNGPWTSFNPSNSLLSIVPNDPTQLGIGTSDVYVGQGGDPVFTVDGLRIGDTNHVYIKVIDLAGAESEVDTSTVFFFKQQTSDLLLISGQDQSVYSDYFDLIGSNYGSYDFFDMSSNAKLPLYFDPTLKLAVQNYDKIIFHSDQTLFTNQRTNEVGLLLKFVAPVLQDFFNAGGKSIISTTFTNNQDIADIVGVMPMDSLARNGAANLPPDSSLVVHPSSSTSLPELSPSLVLFGVDPFYATADAEPVYNANIINWQNWNNDGLPLTVGALRRYQGNISQYYFTIELHNLNNDPALQNQLFDQILNTDFNW